MNKQSSPGGCREACSIEDARDFVRANIIREFFELYGVTNPDYIESVVNNYFCEENDYDGRWSIIDERLPNVGKVLDMAAGCGTFLLHGLRRGNDVWGIEPESWKNEYYGMKIEVSGYPDWFRGRLVQGVGEALPFPDGTFDLVTTYQTIEHVRDVRLCIREMLRVLKPGGVLWIKAPDYDCFWEPHYLVPFLPEMNKRLAGLYLRLLGRPLAGLEPLKYTTSKTTVECCRENGAVRIFNCSYSQPLTLRDLARPGVIRQKLSKTGRTENLIDLWVTKLHPEAP